MGEWAHIVADSISPEGVRIVSVQTQAPRLIHSELLRHRVFSFSAGSSRAVPVTRMLHQVCNDPARPKRFGANKAGMQDAGEHHEMVRSPITGLMLNVDEAWNQAARDAAWWADAFRAAGYHKQVANRLTEPFQMLPCLVTATEWDNFFELRDHDDADPTIRELAVQVKQAMDQSTPRRIPIGGWHVPYVRDEELTYYPWATLTKISAARCARNSYMNHAGDPPTLEEDLLLFDKLVGSKPWHASPLEHQATPARSNPNTESKLPWERWERYELHGNFKGWVQHRKCHENGLTL